MPQAARNSSKLKLGEVQEIETVNWATVCVRQGVAITTRNFVTDVAHAVNSRVYGKKPISLHPQWGDRMARRHPKFLKELDAAIKETKVRRAKNRAPTAIKDERVYFMKWWWRLRNFMRRINVKPENVYLLRNYGHFTIVDAQSKTLATPRLSKKQMQNSNKQVSSALYCFRYGEKPLAPFLTFTEKSGHDQGKSKFATNEDGWITYSDMFDWVKMAFEVDIQPPKGRKPRKALGPPRLLLFDADEVPVNAEFFIMCRMSNIFCYGLPRGSRGIFNDLSHGLLSSIDQEYSRHVDNSLRGRPNGTVHLEDPTYAKFISEKASSGEHVSDEKKAWEKLGLIPLNQKLYRGHVKKWLATIDSTAEDSDQRTTQAGVFLSPPPTPPIRIPISLRRSRTASPFEIINIESSEEKDANDSDSSDSSDEFCAEEERDASKDNKEVDSDGDADSDNDSDSDGDSAATAAVDHSRSTNKRQRELVDPELADTAPKKKKNEMDVLRDEIEMLTARLDEMAEKSEKTKETETTKKSKNIEKTKKPKETPKKNYRSRTA
ncbi:hypothetical protein N7520_000062 [Penicillium odoratum]|uniref:uncharacterized protein n=1 Tax=Penicillium odoratum TaxID=1167516 RepID=UPI00254942C3|nr:uncharacterized protein N7520_000062 [Penicillium odoratum]KAJ5776816.1 hypothetical protein N7520_000062 [Penicillium odoratum]